MTSDNVQKVVKIEPSKPTQESNVVPLSEISLPKSQPTQPPKPTQESNIVTKTEKPKDGKQ